VVKGAAVARDAQDPPDLVFYDASCPLCRVAVGLVARADHRGTSFRFAPIGGTTFLNLLSDEQRRAAPDSLLLRTDDGRVLSRSGAVLQALSRLGPAWRLAAAAARLVPRCLRDAAYDLVARLRRRVLPRANGDLGLVSAPHPERFDP
jgi:predicted DCC family thiol-disulfide oxidoreductase YuxK